MEKIIRLRDQPAFVREASFWFSQKWALPQKAYEKSMRVCIGARDAIPQWYLLLDHNQKIIAGAGVIENDFHNRPDLTPNLCALYVEKAWRGQGAAKRMLDFIRKDIGALGFSELYLVTDHTAFYEKCGWTFFTMVFDSAQQEMRLYHAPTAIL